MNKKNNILYIFLFFPLCIMGQIGINTESPIVRGEAQDVGGGEAARFSIYRPPERDRLQEKREGVETDGESQLYLRLTGRWRRTEGRDRYQKLHEKPRIRDALPCMT